MKRRSSGSIVFWLVAASVAGCDNPLVTHPEQTAPESALTMARFAPDAPPLAESVVSFWAHRMEDRQVVIRYVDNGYPEGICLKFLVPAGSLLPGQSAMQGDSVRITVRVIDAERFDFRFEPAGLQFDTSNPAWLSVYYGWADPDFNGDGVIDEQDAALEARLAFWRQEEAGEPLQQMATTRNSVEQSLRAAIGGFTRYAVASD